jgi:hypothetical protein
MTDAWADEDAEQDTLRALLLEGPDMRLFRREDGSLGVELRAHTLRGAMQELGLASQAMRRRIHHPDKHKPRRRRGARLAVSLPAGEGALAHGSPTATPPAPQALAHPEEPE